MGAFDLFNEFILATGPVLFRKVMGMTKETKEHGHDGVRHELSGWLDCHMEERRAKYATAVKEAERLAMEKGQDAPEKPGDLQAEIDAMLEGKPTATVTVDPAEIQFEFGVGDLIVMENNPNSHNYPLGKPALLWINGGVSPKALYWDKDGKAQLGNSPPLEAGDGYKKPMKNAHVRLATEEETDAWLEAFLKHTQNMERLDSSPTGMLAVALDRAAMLEAEVEF